MSASCSSYKCWLCLEDMLLYVAHPEAKGQAQHACCLRCWRKWIDTQLEQNATLTAEDATTSEHARSDPSRPRIHIPTGSLPPPPTRKKEDAPRVAVRCMLCTVAISQTLVYRACRGDASLTRRVDRAMSGVLLMPDYQSCPKSSCPGGGFTLTPGEWQLSCGTCGTCWTRSPLRLDGTTTPDDADSSQWKQRNSKPCPRCTAPVERNGGCLHMNCTRCRAAYCWACLRPLPGDHSRCVPERPGPDPLDDAIQRVADQFWPIVRRVGPVRASFVMALLLFAIFLLLHAPRDPHSLVVSIITNL